MSKNRNWNITINQGALCYPHIKQIVQDLKCKYAYIEHNDNEEQPHIHLCLFLESGREFSTIQKIFDGSHIEVMHYKNDSLQYLIHKNDKEKKQYDIALINSNMADLYEIINTDQVEYFNPRKIHIYFMEGCHTFTNYYIRFGPQVKPYIGIINQVIHDITHNSHLTHEIEALYEEEQNPF